MAPYPVDEHQDWLDTALQNPVDTESSYNPSRKHKAAVFLASKYTYCYVKLNSALWNVDTASAKYGICVKFLSAASTFFQSN
jgi:hypothetical protein